MPAVIDRNDLPEILVKVLDYSLRIKATDVHFRADKPVYMRIAKHMIPFPEFGYFTKKDMEIFVDSLLSKAVKGVVTSRGQVETSFNYANVARFRLTVFLSMGRFALSFRYIPLKVPKPEELNLPSAVKKVVDFSDGIVLVVGPTGSGKTTTLASMVDMLNEQRRLHILTLEDPVEYQFEDKSSLVTQRSLDSDSNDFKTMLREALREDPDVIVIGEMRSREDFEFGIQAADSGHLVFAALHTVDTVQTIHRIEDAFPPEAQRQIRDSLSTLIRAVFAQRLLPNKNNDGVVPAVEIAWGTHIEKQIRENNIDMIYDIIKKGTELGMQTLNQAIAKLVAEDLVAPEEAMRATHKPKELALLLKGFRGSALGGTGIDWFGD